MRIRHVIRVSTWILPLLTFFLGGCSDKTPQAISEIPSQAQVIRENQRYISEHYATFRKKQIADIAYHFDIDLLDRDLFRGVATIDFTLVKPGDAVTLDFDAGEVTSVTVNGVAIETDYQKWFITLPNNSVKEGMNTVVIEYQRPYVSNGAGLNQYQDTASGNYYLYTQFEPYEANKFAPVFDQPNLKATMSMTVNAPEGWQVISTTRENAIESIPGGRRWHFPSSLTLPTYVFSLHAGPYTVWEDDYQLTPLRLFARSEVADRVDPELWFSITRDSFAFFNAYYDFPYPFHKYDQVIVPNFNFGAMENVGAVTFSENRFVQAGAPTPTETVRLALVIAHEMAHMWFGNVVTMDWWSGLWLNESFATLMSYKAIDANPQYGDAANSFLTLKNWGYYEDQLVTTHPIDMGVSHPGEAFNLIDGISYAKGAAVLKQLSHLVGQEAFRTAIADYIKKHQYSNTTLNDFTKAISQTSGLEMSTWKVEWLYVPGVNTIKPEYSCEDGYLTALAIRQSSPPQWPELRRQRVQLAFFTRQPGGHMTLSSTLPVTYDTAYTQASLPEESRIVCPDFVYANYEEWGYVKLALDETSLAALKTGGVSQFKDDYLRSAVWQILWDMTQTMSLSLTDYVHFLVANINDESNVTTLESLKKIVTHAFDELESMPSSATITGLLRSLETTSWQLFEQAGDGTIKQRVFFEFAVGSTHSPEKLAHLKTLLTGKNPPELLANQDLRWLAVQRLNRYAVAGADELADQELQRDDSETSRQAALVAQAIQPKMAIKRAWLEKLLDDSEKVKMSDLRIVWENLFPGRQRQLHQQLSEEILSALPKLSATRDAIFLDKMTGPLLPTACRQASVDALARIIDGNQKLAAPVVRSLRIKHQEDERCVAKSRLLPTGGQQ